jgi:hypothetical protein
MTMQALTDYSDAHDSQGEREDAKQEARDVLHAKLTADYDTLKDVIAEAIAGMSKDDLVTALAYQMAANWGDLNAAAWDAPLRRSLIADDSSAVDSIIGAEICARLIIEGDKP